VFNPNVFYPNVFDPNVFDPNVFDPNVFDPNVFDPNVFDPNVLGQKNVTPKYEVGQMSVETIVSQPKMAQIFLPSCLYNVYGS
jgi:hypothetical protein